VTSSLVSDLPSKEKLIKYFEFLDGLRESGAVNMFGAGLVIRDAFGLTGKMARAVHMAWMETFDGKTKLADRVAQAKGGQ
jgi:hypothetical protein